LRGDDLSNPAFDFARTLGIFIRAYPPESIHRLIGGLR
jgi:hypothetical protein